MGKKPRLLVGIAGSGSGETRLELGLLATRATLRVFSQWMGDEEPLDLELVCRHSPRGSHSAALILLSARRTGTATPVPLPPSEGAIVMEYVRVPIQRAKLAGNDSMAAAGRWTDPYSMVLWLHREATFDDGTDLESAEYEVPPSEFAPVVKALQILERPWKLG